MYKHLVSFVRFEAIIFIIRQNMLYNIRFYLYCLVLWLIFEVLKTTTNTYNYENLHRLQKGKRDFGEIGLLGIK